MKNRAYQSQTCFSARFFETFLSKRKMDIYKCPFLKCSKLLCFLFSFFLKDIIKQLKEIYFKIIVSLIIFLAICL